MLDDTRAALAQAVRDEGESSWPDLDFVTRRGRRIKTVRSLAIAFVTLGVVAAGVGSAALLTGPDRSPVMPRPVGPGEDRMEPVIENMTEQEQAEVFALRAMAATGVMTPLGEHTYTWFSDATSASGGTWRIGFTAADCSPRGGPEGQSQTCRSLTGTEGSDDEPRRADTFVAVERDTDVWRVTGMEGVITAQHRERVVGFELRQEPEPSHWELPAISIWDTLGGPSLQMWPLWVGPYPTTAPGSVCEVQALDAEGRPVGDPGTFYVEPPDNEYSRANWVMGRGLDVEDDYVDAEATCRQYTGAGWEVEQGPDLIADGTAILGVSARLVWKGDRGFTASAVCRATLVDEDGAPVWEGSERVLPLWRPSELRDYPYHADVVVPTGGDPIEGGRPGEFDCETR